MGDGSTFSLISWKILHIQLIGQNPNMPQFLLRNIQNGRIFHTDFSKVDHQIGRDRKNGPIVLIFNRIQCQCSSKYLEGTKSKSSKSFWMCGTHMHKPNIPLPQLWCRVKKFKFKNNITKLQLLSRAYQRHKENTYML